MFISRANRLIFNTLCKFSDCNTLIKKKEKYMSQKMCHCIFVFDKPKTFEKMKNIYLILFCMMCTICKSQTVGTGISVGHVTLSSGTEVNACCDMNDNLLEVQVEGNTDYVEVFVIRNGEVEDYDVTNLTDDIFTFCLPVQENTQYNIYVRTKEEEGCIYFNLTRE